MLSFRPDGDQKITFANSCLSIFLDDRSRRARSYWKSVPDPIFYLQPSPFFRLWEEGSKRKPEAIIVKIKSHRLSLLFYIYSILPHFLTGCIAQRWKRIKRGKKVRRMSFRKRRREKEMSSKLKLWVDFEDRVPQLHRFHKFCRQPVSDRAAFAQQKTVRTVREWRVCVCVCVCLEGYCWRDLN